MVVIVDVSAAGARPPVGVPLVVEVRDTAMADEPSVTLARVASVVRGQHGQWLDTVELRLPGQPLGATAWAHVDAAGAGRVSKGDWVTTASHPVPPGDEVRVAVTVKQVV